ncbi:hypothetical protein [Pseudoalteromonas luteoviolacea]|uniref:Uncharacterized protein n=1 Tax=Pseudoalteromonas luteoviolacea S4060-1 TaxID=1365257 RepID=A0A162C7A3_9GAMM|nr:hypothetical protein [Pseudoalteromonas luteoviolacea]KZN63323.1 hypothetical protein N478_03475 [Pseudoalteromonas luteoviolacea S4060-1]
MVENRKSSYYVLVKDSELSEGINVFLGLTKDKFACHSEVSGNIEVHLYNKNRERFYDKSKFLAVLDVLSAEIADEILNASFATGFLKGITNDNLRASAVADFQMYLCGKNQFNFHTDLDFVTEEVIHDYEPDVYAIANNDSGYPSKYQIYSKSDPRPKFAFIVNVSERLGIDTLDDDDIATLLIRYFDCEVVNTTENSNVLAITDCINCRYPVELEELRCEIEGFILSRYKTSLVAKS